MKLRERIELDRTLSKYRSDINNILAMSNVRNRFHQSTASALASVADEDRRAESTKIEPADDVIYTKTVQPSAADIVTQVHYCPRPARSAKPAGFVDSFRTAFVRNNDHNPAAYWVHGSNGVNPSNSSAQAVFSSHGK